MHNDDTIATGLESVARSIENLGNAGAVTPSGATMGAIEYLGMTLQESLGSIAEAIEHLARAVEDSRE